VLDVLAGTILTRLGLPGLMPLPWGQTLTIFVYSLTACLGLNDALKVALIQWLVIRARAEQPVDSAPRSPTENSASPFVPRSSRRMLKKFGKGHFFERES